MSRWRLDLMTSAVPRFDGPLPCDLPDGLPLTAHERLWCLGEWVDAGFVSDDEAQRVADEAGL